jgi:hypothetical protein
MSFPNLSFIVQAESKLRKEPLKKRSERNVSNIPKTKKKQRNPRLPFEIKATQVIFSRSPKPRKCPIKENKQKER